MATNEPALAGPPLTAVRTALTPGLLVRPRPGRVELGTDYVAGEHLRAATAFAAGGVMAALQATQGDRSARRSLPPAIRAVTVPDPRRYGWFVDRRAFGTDLYDGGRESSLPLRRGGRIAAGVHLAAAWAAARRALVGRADRDELELVDRIVAGPRALPLDDPEPGTFAAASGLGLPAIERGRPARDAVEPRRRGGVEIAPVVVRWEYIVYRLSAAGLRSGYACIPRTSLNGFLDGFDDGTLAGRLRAFLEEPAGDRILRSFGQTASPAL